MPMLYFTLAVGAVHVAVGLVLGFVTALRGRRTKEAVFRILSLLIIVCIAGLLASYLAPVTALLRRPLMAALLVIGPVLLLTGRRLCAVRAVCGTSATSFPTCESWRSASRPRCSPTSRTSSPAPPAVSGSASR